MGMKPCKECGKEVSTSAKKCPNCGKPSPTGGLTLTGKVFGLEVFPQRMKPCKDCGKEVSTSAKTCPNCGKPSPTNSLDLNAKVIGFSLLAVFVFAIAGYGDPEATQQSTRATPEATQQATRAFSEATPPARRAYPPRSRKEFLDFVATGRNEHWASVTGVLIGGTWSSTFPSGNVNLTFVDSTSLYVESQIVQTGQRFDDTFQWATFHITTSDDALLFWLCWIDDSPLYTCWDAELRQTTYQGHNTIGLYYEEYFSTLNMEFQPSTKRGSYYLNP